MAKSEDNMAASPDAIGESEGQTSPSPLTARMAALEAKRVFLDRAIAWQENSRATASDGDAAEQGANLLALQVKQQLAAQTLSLAMAEERSILLRF